MYQSKAIKSYNISIKMYNFKQIKQIVGKVLIVIDLDLLVEQRRDIGHQYHNLQAHKLIRINIKLILTKSQKNKKKRNK